MFAPSAVWRGDIDNVVSTFAASSIRCSPPCRESAAGLRGAELGTAYDQLDHQRRFITERLETLRARLDEYRSQQTALAEKRILMENIVTWAEKMGDRLDDLSDEGRREVLQLLLDGATIDRDNNVEITLAVPIDEFVSIEPPASDSRCRTRLRSR